MDQIGDDPPRCGHPTKSGRPCRNQVDRAGRPCRIHMKAVLLERLLGSQDTSAGGDVDSDDDSAVED